MMHLRQCYKYDYPAPNQVQFQSESQTSWTRNTNHMLSKRSMHRNTKHNNRTCVTLGKHWTYRLNAEQQNKALYYGLMRTTILVTIQTERRAPQGQWAIGNRPEAIGNRR